ncbi:FAD-dependent oxidoreductase [Glutamicibacter sp. PS]|uniref:NAD(P)/FAD-dependent oxidoreductase n=1 Tax=Glutamicibacter sp. PS TaxID=3075634 RepID=UPI002851C13B|nr:FAD-dependent oxidoreductase [Glutamicibacter sp. PS]MDR4533940.1 FAD-binding oxidoreductase [Glutamicibacter sp. PS]
MVRDAGPEHVVIVGAGIVGLSTAWYLQRYGVRVTVVDRGVVAAGSSWGNAGWLTPALTLPLAEPAILRSGLKMILDPASALYIPPRLDLGVLRFLLGFGWHCTPRQWARAMAVFSHLGGSGMEAYAELSEADTAGPGVSEPTRAATPFLAAFRTETDRAVLAREFEMISRSGGSVDFRLLDAAQLRAMEPSLSPQVRCGVAIEHQRFINPPRFLAALADSVRARGGQIMEALQVTDVRAGARQVKIIGSSGRALTADRVVLATGAWLGDLARDFGVRVRVQAGRGYSFSVQPEQLPSRPIYFPAQRVACTPLGDRLRIAGTMEFRDANHRLEPARIEAIVAAVAPLYTGIEWEERAEEWVGARPCTADGLPLVGQTNSERVFVAGGHGMWGVALGPLTGKMLAAQIVGDEPVPELAAQFNPLRRGF